MRFDHLKEIFHFTGQTWNKLKTHIFNHLDWFYYTRRRYWNQPYQDIEMWGSDCGTWLISFRLVWLISRKYFISYGKHVINWKHTFSIIQTMYNIHEKYIESKLAEILTVNNWCGAGSNCGTWVIAWDWIVSMKNLIIQTMFGEAIESKLSKRLTFWDLQSVNVEIVLVRVCTFLSVGGIM